MADREPLVIVDGSYQEVPAGDNLIVPSLGAGTNTAQSGAIRLPNALWLVSRNAANSADVNLLRLNVSNEAEIGASFLPIKDEGSSQGRVGTLNFTGAGISASVAGGEATVNVTGGSGPLLAARVYHSTTQSLTTASETALAFDSENYDTDVIHDNATNNSRLTCKTAGKYIITGGIEIAANALGTRQIRIRLNGATVIAQEKQLNALGTDATRLTITAVYDLAANDYVELMALQDSGSSLNANSGAGVTWFSMTGPTGSASGFTEGSVLFAGPSGILAQDNANFFWDDTNNRLRLGTNPATSGILNVPNAQYTAHRNAANSADLNGWRANASNYLDFGTNIYYDEWGGYADQNALMTLRKNYTTPPSGKNPIVHLQFQTKQSGSIGDGHTCLRAYPFDRTDVTNKTITNAVNNGSSLIRITATAHGYATSDKLTVYGVLGTTEANGLWTITVIDADTFDLQGSTFTNTYTSGGTATNRGLLYGYTCSCFLNIPHDGFGTGVNVNGDDVALYTATNGSSAANRATDAFYISHNTVFGTGGSAVNEFAAGFSCEANCNNAFTAGGTYAIAVLDTSRADFIGSGVAIKMDNAHVIASLNAAGGTLLPLLSCDTSNKASLFNGAVTLNATDLAVTTGVTQRFYNTADQTTNFERLDIGFGIVTANRAEIRTNKGGTGTARTLGILYGTTSAYAMTVPTAAVSGVTISSGNVTSAATSGRLIVTAAANNTATSGTSIGIMYNELYAPTATSTMVCQPLRIAPTINFSNGTPGAGSYEAISVGIIETALPTGTNYLCRMSAGSGGTTEKFSVKNNGDTTLIGILSAASVAGTMVATQSDLETATSTTTVTSPGNQHFHPGHPKCWAFVTVSAGTPTLQTSYNITSITDTGTGALTVTIATDFSGTNWCSLASVEDASTTIARSITYDSKAAGSVLLRSVVEAGSASDPVSWSFLGLGDL